MRPDTKAVKDLLVELDFPSPRVSYSETQYCGAITGSIDIVSMDTYNRDSENQWCKKTRGNADHVQRLASVGCRIAGFPDNSVLAGEFRLVHDDYDALSDFLGDIDIGVHFVQSNKPKEGL